MLTLPALLDEFILYARAAEYSPQTIGWYQKEVGRLESWLRHEGHTADCEQMTPHLIRSYLVTLQEAGLAPRTRLNALQSVKTLMAFGVREGLLDSNPADGIPKPKLPDRDYVIFEPAQVDALLGACNPRTVTGRRDMAIITLLFDSGIRAGELLGLTPADVDWQRGLLRVYGKGAKERPVPVSARTLRVVRRYLTIRGASHDDPSLFVNRSGAPLSYTALIQALRRLGRRTGLHVHPHKFRHSFAVNALRNGAREFDIQGCLGHTTLEMTRHYARQSGIDLAVAHRRFSPGDTLRARG